MTTPIARSLFSGSAAKPGRPLSFDERYFGLWHRFRADRSPCCLRIPSRARKCSGTFRQKRPIRCIGTGLGDFGNF